MKLWGEGVGASYKTRTGSPKIVVRAPANIAGIVKGALLTREESVIDEVNKWVSAHFGLSIGHSLMEDGPGTFSIIKEAGDILTRAKLVLGGQWLCN